MYIKLFILFQNGLFGLFGTKNMGIDTKMKSLRVLQAELWPNAFFVAAILEKWRHYEIIAKYDKIFKEKVKYFIFRRLAIRKVSKISTNPIHVGLIVSLTRTLKIMAAILNRDVSRLQYAKILSNWYFSYQERSLMLFEK